MKKLKSFRILTTAFTVTGLLFSSALGFFPAALPQTSATALAATTAETDNYPLEDTTATAQIATAQAAYDEAKAAYDEGSFGFFQSVGATSAIEALTSSKIASYTKKGETEDATSLENMKLALSNIVNQIDSPYFDDTESSMTYVDKCNYLRGKNGAGELKITDYMMATAQADCNYSDTVVSHAQVFNVGENLAWNYGSDPFAQWYDEEYALFKNGTTDFSEIGHYKNVINTSYNYTGFAICTRGSMYRWNTYGQTFSYSTSDTSYTVSEYAERFMEYYNSVCNSLTEAEEELESAKEEAEENKAAPVLSKDISLTYTGAGICPVTVVTKKGDTLKEGTDYTITYNNNIEPGTATATVTGIGSYSGTAEISFIINSNTPASTDTKTDNSSTTTITPETQKSESNNETATEETTADDDDETENDDFSIKLSESKISLYVGQKKQIKASIISTDDFYEEGDIEWKSSNTKVAKVSDSGQISAVKKGTAIITATIDEVSEEIKVTVKNSKLTVKDGKKSITKISIKKGKSKTYKISTTPGSYKIKLSNIKKKVKKSIRIKLTKTKLKITGIKKGSFTITLNITGTKKKIKIQVL